MIDHIADFDWESEEMACSLVSGSRILLLVCRRHLNSVQVDTCSRKCS